MLTIPLHGEACAIPKRKQIVDRRRETMRKTSRRLAAILLATLMSFSIAAVPIISADAQVFKDVPETAWFHGYVMMLYEKGIVKGYGTSGEFRPDNKLTREEAAKMIAKAAGLPYQGKKAAFPDVDPNSEMSPYIAALKEAGAVSGIGQTGKFKPLDNIKRGHAAKMVGLAFGLKEGDMTQALTDLPDDATVSVAIETLASNGIVKGRGASKEFKPEDEINRAEISKIICIAMVVQAIQKAEEEPSPENLEAAQELVKDLPPEQGDTSTLDYLTGRLEVLEEAEPLSEVQVKGLTQVGVKLEADVDPHHAKVTYQWQSSSSEKGAYTDIAGAKQKTYLLDSKDLGCYIRVKVEGDKGFQGSLVSRPRGPVKKLHSTYVQELSGHQRNFVTMATMPYHVEGGSPQLQGPTEAQLAGNPPIQVTRRSKQDAEPFYDRLWQVVTVDAQPPGSEIQLWQEMGGKTYINKLGRYGNVRSYQYTADYSRTDDFYAFANKPGKYTLTFRLMEDQDDQADWLAIVHEITITLNFVSP